MDGRVRAPEVHVQLLGALRVTVNGEQVTALAQHRRAAELVKLLALARQRRMHRNQVAEALWGHLGPEAAVANLHKAASYARTSLGAKGAVVLRGGWEIGRASCRERV